MELTVEEYEALLLGLSVGMRSHELDDYPDDRKALRLLFQKLAKARRDEVNHVNADDDGAGGNAGN